MYLRKSVAVTEGAPVAKFMTKMRQQMFLGRKRPRSAGENAPANVSRSKESTKRLLSECWHSGWIFWTTFSMVYYLSSKDAGPPPKITAARQNTCFLFCFLYPRGFPYRGISFGDLRLSDLRYPVVEPGAHMPRSVRGPRVVQVDMCTSRTPW